MHVHILINGVLPLCGICRRSVPVSDASLTHTSHANTQHTGDHRALLMCCLSVATYRVLNDEIEDTKLVGLCACLYLYACVNVCVRVCDESVRFRDMRVVFAMTVVTVVLSSESSLQ